MRKYITKGWTSLLLIILIERSLLSSATKVPYTTLNIKGYIIDPSTQMHKYVFEILQYLAINCLENDRNLDNCLVIKNYGS